MERLFVDYPLTEGMTIKLADKKDSEYHHLIRVLRLHEQDELKIVDINERVFLASIEQINAKNNVKNSNKNTHTSKNKEKNREIQEDYADIIIKKELFEKRETFFYYTLFQGIAKNDKMDYIFQKSTELGVHEIYPLLVSRCQGNSDYLKNPKEKLDRAQKIIKAAAIQAQRNKVPQIHSPIDLVALLPKLSEYDYIFLAYENEQKQNLADFFKAKENNNENIMSKFKASGQRPSIAIIIGPEGGITPEEYELLVKQGAISVSLGKTILRTETASLVLLSQLEYAFSTML